MDPEQDGIAESKGRSTDKHGSILLPATSPQTKQERAKDDDDFDYDEYCPNDAVIGKSDCGMEDSITANSHDPTDCAEVGEDCATIQRDGRERVAGTNDNSQV
jgi:hypothetical protein